MNRLRSIDIRRTMAAATALGAVGLATACGASYETIPANTPLRVLGESEDTRYITAEQSGGYPHYETTYRFDVMYCDKKTINTDDETTDADGCQELSVTVSKESYETFGPGDTISFSTDRSAAIYKN